jgi:hypothetical protein
MESRKENFRPENKGLKSETTKISPEVYFVDMALYDKLCKVYSDCFDYFQKIAQAFPVLEIGTLDAEVLHKISKNNFADIWEKFNGKIEESVKDVPNSVVRTHLTKDARLPYSQFKMQAESDLLQVSRILRTHQVELYTDIFSISKDGTLDFSNKDKTKLKAQFCTIIIDSQAKKEFIQLSQETLLGLQKIKSVLLRNSVNNSLFGSGNLFDDNGGVILNKTIMSQINK